MLDDNHELVLDPNWVTKMVYLSKARLADLDHDLANMTVTTEESEAAMTDEAINALPDVLGCVITTIESLTGEETG